MVAHRGAATYSATMRLLAAILTASLLSGCTSLVLADPAIRVAPYLAIYELRGDTSMQSAAPGGGSPSPAPQNNPAQSLQTFGQDRSHEDVGIRVDIGDGFGGIRADYYRLDMDTSRKGELQSDWGSLLAGDQVSMYAEMDELRLGYIQPIFDHRTDYRDDELQLKFGAGGTFATRQMKLRGREETNTRGQNLEMDGDLVFVALSAQANWRQLSFEVDYSIAPEFFVLSGDFEDLSQDFEARITYELPQRDINFFAGVRYSEFSADGSSGSFRYSSDLKIDGFQIGVSIVL
jgi:hypothetical protein